MNRLKWTAVVRLLVVLCAMAYGYGHANGVIGSGTNKVHAGETKETLGVPDDLKGFRGMLIGVVIKKGEREFIIEVKKITRTWKGNEAKKAPAAIGKKAVCELSPSSRLYEQHRTTRARLKAGDCVLVEPFHLEPNHDHLTVVEELKKVEPEPDAKPEGGRLGVPKELRGFKGMLTGIIVKKGAHEFIIEIEKINKTWNGNKAENPQAAVGKKAVCELWKKSHLLEKHRAILSELKPGDRVLVEPFHLEEGHNHLTVVEGLSKED